MLPPFGWGEAATNWQFAPIVTAFTALVAAAYLWGVLRVRRRHPRRPWPLGRTILFVLGLLVINVATQMLPSLSTAIESTSCHPSRLARMSPGAYGVFGGLSTPGDSMSQHHRRLVMVSTA